MARSSRPASESYQPVCYTGSQSFSFSSDVSLEDHAPIFSLSKSSMDVVMTGLPHKRDPAWARADLRRSSSTNTHTEQSSQLTIRQLHPHLWQQPLPPPAQAMEVHSPPALVDRWLPGVQQQRWSQCSGSTQSRSSTPDTVVWKDSRPSSLVQETFSPAAPDSPMSKPATPPTTPSPFISPLQTPTSPFTPNTPQQKDFPAPSPTHSPPDQTSSPLPPDSPNLLQLTGMEDEGFLENNSFTFPSPIPSSLSLAEGAAPSDPGSVTNDVIEELQSPGGDQETEEGEIRETEPTSCSPLAECPTEGQEGQAGASVCYLELLWQQGESSRMVRNWRSPLVSSTSDSILGDCCKCSSRGCITKAPKGEELREEATMTSRPDLVDAAVQTSSPIGSLWALRNLSTSNMGSHSILGSPPGSRLNLKSSIGSNSNLVSASSSMFPVSSGEEEEEQEKEKPVDDHIYHDLDRRRSCLKIQAEDREELGRRSSMKQVQWDEDGMTWDIHGASLDPQVLTKAIEKHMELQSTPKVARRSPKKKKAPQPPVKQSTLKAQEVLLPVMIVTHMVDGETDRGREAEEGGGRKRKETEEASRKTSRAEGENIKEEEASEDTKSTSRDSALSRKRSVMWSLKRPGWCGGSRKVED